MGREIEAGVSAWKYLSRYSSARSIFFRRLVNALSSRVAQQTQVSNGETWGTHRPQQKSYFGVLHDTFKWTES